MEFNVPPGRQHLEGSNLAVMVASQCQQRLDIFSFSSQTFLASRFCPAFHYVATKWMFHLQYCIHIVQAGRRGRTKAKRLNSQSHHVFPVFKGLIQEPHLATSADISLSGLCHTATPSCYSKQNKDSVRKRRGWILHRDPPLSAILPSLLTSACTIPPDVSSHVHSFP